MGFRCTDFSPSLMSQTCELGPASQNLPSFWPSVNGWVRPLCLPGLSESSAFGGISKTQTVFPYGLYGMQIWSVELLLPFRHHRGKPVWEECWLLKKGRAEGTRKKRHCSPTQSTRQAWHLVMWALCLYRTQQIIFLCISKRKRKLLDSPSLNLQTKFTLMNCLFLSKPQVSLMLWISLH